MTWGVHLRTLKEFFPKASNQMDSRELVLRELVFGKMFFEKISFRKILREDFKVVVFF